MPRSFHPIWAALVAASRDLVLGEALSTASAPGPGGVLVVDATVEGEVRDGTSVLAGAVVEGGAVVSGSVLMPGARVGEGAVVTDSVLGPGSIVCAGARLNEVALGDEAVVPEGVVLPAGMRVPCGETAS